MGRAIGIDLGTTYSAVACLNENGENKVLINAEGENTTPSVVFFQDDGGKDVPLVGTMAKHMAATSPDDVVQFVKRQMGDPNWVFYSSTGTKYTAEEISAVILKKLKQDAELALGEPVTDAVITVPAYFDDARRVATKQAGRIAGFNVMRVLNEPTAAAISYGLDAEENGTILIYDLGGGTFDVTILSKEDNKFRVIATDGDRNLGGFDFDNALMNYVADEVELQGGTGIKDDFQALADLREKCELAKRTLSNVAKTRVFITHNGKNYGVTVTRDQFDEMTKNLLNRTEILVNDVLGAADMTWNDIDHVLLIGGSTRMPMIRELVERISGKTPEAGINPDEAVALGAAVQAMLEVAQGASAADDYVGGDGSTASAASSSATSSAELDLLPENVRGIEIQDVTSQALGVAALEEGSDQLFNSIIIDRNTPIPASSSRDFSTIRDNQTEVNVQVYQGDDRDLDYDVLLGEQTLTIDPHPRGAGIRVTFHYDIDQTVQIEVKDLTNGKDMGFFEIERVANMDDAAVDKATERMRQIIVE